MPTVSKHIATTTLHSLPSWIVTVNFVPRPIVSVSQAILVVWIVFSNGVIQDELTAQVQRLMNSLHACSAGLAWVWLHRLNGEIRMFLDNTTYIIGAAVLLFSDLRVYENHLVILRKALLQTLPLEMIIGWSRAFLGTCTSISQIWWVPKFENHWSKLYSPKVCIELTPLKAEMGWAFPDSKFCFRVESGDHRGSTIFWGGKLHISTSLLNTVTCVPRATNGRWLRWHGQLEQINILYSHCLIGYPLAACDYWALKMWLVKAKI